MRELIDMSEFAHQVVGRFEFSHTKLDFAEFHLLVDAIAAALTTAKLTERESCAQIAEWGIAETDPGAYNNACRNIAAAIRGGSHD